MTAGREAALAQRRPAAVDARRPARRRTLPWLVPLLLVLGVFYLVPILDAARLAFTDATLLDRNEHYTLASARAMLGHADLGTTERYTHVSDRRRREVYFSAHPHARRKDPASDKTG